MNLLYDFYVYSDLRYTQIESQRRERLSNHVKLLRVIPACHLDEGVVLPEPGLRIFSANKKGQKKRNIELIRSIEGQYN